MMITDHASNLTPNFRHSTEHSHIDKEALNYIY